MWLVIHWQRRYLLFNSFLELTSGLPGAVVQFGHCTRASDLTVEKGLKPHPGPLTRPCAKVQGSTIPEINLHEGRVHNSLSSLPSV